MSISLRWTPHPLHLSSHARPPQPQCRRAGASTDSRPGTADLNILPVDLPRTPQVPATLSDPGAAHVPELRTPGLQAALRRGPRHARLLQGRAPSAGGGFRHCEGRSGQGCGRPRRRGPRSHGAGAATERAFLRRRQRPRARPRRLAVPRA